MTVRRIAIGVTVAAVCLVATLALPVETWRTGRISVPPLVLTAPDAEANPPRRVWIDTDAACGYTPRTDVDDCLALWLAAATPELDVAGVSTVFGNAPLEVTDRITRELVGLLHWQGRRRPVAVHRGAQDRLTSGATAARDELIRALEDGSLTIVALGPLTNVTQALAARPDLRGNARRIVAVMGRRAGHLFHPSEGSGRGMLLGHGPVFRDFNFSADPEAARALMAMNLPTTLIPYDAARHVEITSSDLRTLAGDAGAGAWIARRSRAWLEYWRTEIGRSGFYPFDLMAVAHVTAPALFRCADVRAWVGKDPLLFVPLLRPEALLVGPHEAGTHQRRALYCPVVEPGLEAGVHTLLSAAS
jgi:inosine-uridine nucleoside N-ribohydrolase